MISGFSPLLIQRSANSWKNWFKTCGRSLKRPISHYPLDHCLVFPLAAPLDLASATIATLTAVCGDSTGGISNSVINGQPWPAPTRMARSPAPPGCLPAFRRWNGIQQIR